MAGDWFLDLFTGEAERLLSQLREEAGSRQAGGGVPVYWWVAGLPEPGGDPGPVAAVDGGGGMVPLSTGGTVYVARAYGYVEEGEPERALELRLYSARDSRVLDALRSWVEHRAAVRLVLRLPPGSLLLMDGSYWVLATAALTAVAKLAKGLVQSMAGVYTAVLSAYTLVELAELAELASQRGVTLAYVSKDHGFRALKEKVLLDMVSSAAPQLEPLLRGALEWYPLALRDRLLEARRLVPEGLRPVYDAALDTSYRDPVFMAETVGPGPGYTWLLRLPPPRRLHRVVATRGSRGLVDAAADRASQLVAGEREAEEMSSLRDRLARAVDQLPATRMLYVRLAAGDAPLLVEVPGEPGGYHSPGRVLEEPGSTVVDLVARLARHYAGPDYYNVPLVAAHLNATLDGGQLRLYTRLLEQLAAAHGAPLALARRTGMAGLKRRRRRRRI